MEDFPDWLNPFYRSPLRELYWTVLGLLSVVLVFVLMGGLGIWWTGLLAIVNAGLFIATRLAFKRADKRLSLISLAKEEMVEFDQVLGGLDFDPQREGVAPDAVQDHREALQRRADAARLRHGSQALDATGDALAALRRLEMRLYGDSRIDRSDSWRARERERLARIDDPGPPLHVLNGAGNAVVPLPEGLPDHVLMTAGDHGAIRVELLRHRKGEAEETVFTGGRKVVGLWEVRHLRIEAEGAWAISLHDAGGVPRFTSQAEGEGDDVLFYRGPKGIAFIEAEPGFEVVGLARDLGWLEQIASSHHGCVALGGPALMSIQAKGKWRIVVTEAAEIRDFDTDIKGRGDEVVRYTGPDAMIDASWAGQWFELHRLDGEFHRESELIASVPRRRTSVRPQRGSVRLRHGALLQVLADHEEWTLAVSR
ncbi:hypothetical protein [Actinomadura macrotermitis]|uniref:Uncharacterized protein n=1 Tax=Actinomadura macrotermitis TaxID=2585200 RepID=A0A7K0BWC9_9ACTN|nr:hypothetical protein [Actinomadura macrotermitis]MQY04994.1 hypothetical protein [Actinomadura macrotermitis]